MCTGNYTSAGKVRNAQKIALKTEIKNGILPLSIKTKTEKNECSVFILQLLFFSV